MRASTAANAPFAARWVVLHSSCTVMCVPFHLRIMCCHTRLWLHSHRYDCKQALWGTHQGHDDAGWFVTALATMDIYIYKYMEMVATSPTPRSAVTRHQRVRNAVWSDSRQTTRRAIPRHETTRIVVHIDAHTCVCNFFLKSLYW